MSGWAKAWNDSHYNLRMDFLDRKIMEATKHAIEELKQEIIAAINMEITDEATAAAKDLKKRIVDIFNQ